MSHVCCHSCMQPVLAKLPWRVRIRLARNGLIMLETKKLRVEQSRGSFSHICCRRIRRDLLIHWWSFDDICAHGVRSVSSEAWTERVTTAATDDANNNNTHSKENKTQYRHEWITWRVIVDAMAITTLGIRSVFVETIRIIRASFDAAQENESESSKLSQVRHVDHGKRATEFFVQGDLKDEQYPVKYNDMH